MSQALKMKNAVNTISLDVNGEKLTATDTSNVEYVYRLTRHNDQDDAADYGSWSKAAHDLLNMRDVADELESEIREDGISLEDSDAVDHWFFWNDTLVEEIAAKHGYKLEKIGPSIMPGAVAVCLALALSSCAQNYSITENSEQPNPGPIHKLNQVMGAVGEMTPIDFNGKVYLISFANNDTGNGFIKVQNYPDFSTFSQTPFAYNFGCAYVENNVVHVFASSNTMDGPGNRVVTATSTDLIHWSAPTVIFTAPSNQIIYNSSVTKTDTGYVMAYEIRETGNYSRFFPKFLFSNDLINWSSFGGTYSTSIENACPTIRYLNGWYYLFTMTDRMSVVDHSRYYTVVARSRDLVTFEESPREVLNNFGRTDEGLNNSDLDFVEVNGQVLFVYLVGDQETFGFMKLGSYSGTFEQFIKEFFL